MPMDNKRKNNYIIGKDVQTCFKCFQKEKSRKKIFYKSKLVYIKI